MENPFYDRAVIAYGNMNFTDGSQLLQEGAQNGEPLALLMRAGEYKNGRQYSVDKNEADLLAQRAVSALMRAAAQGDPEAMIWLGRCHVWGDLLPKDRTLALNYFRSAAAAGSVEAVREEADLLAADGAGTQASLAASKLYEEVLRRYREDAARGDALAIWQLFYAYDRGELGLVPNPSDAVNLLRRLAARDARALRTLAEKYDQGVGVDRDPDEAMRLFSMAAGMGDVRAMVVTADWFREQKADQQALRWYQRAADLGDTRAMTSLGEIHEAGIRVPQDFAAAISAYRKAADAGFPDAIRRLAEMYERGRGVDQDTAEARRLHDVARALSS